MKLVAFIFAMLMAGAVSAKAAPSLRVKVVEEGGNIKRFELVQNIKLVAWNGKKIEKTKTIQVARASEIEVAALRQIWTNNYRIKTKKPAGCKTALEIELPEKNEKSVVCAGDLARLSSSQALLEHIRAAL